jgi:hypothetical protein
MLVDECGVMDYPHVNNPVSFSCLRASILHFVLSSLFSGVGPGPFGADLDRSFQLCFVYLPASLVWQ